MEAFSRSALRVALLYAAFGAVWILASDIVVSLVFGVPYRLTIAQTLKGFLFVAASAALIFWLVRREAVKRASTEDSLATTRSLMTQALDSLGEAVLIVSVDDGMILACNQAAVRMLGYAKDELVGSSTEKLHLDRERYETFRAEVRQAMSERDRYETPYRVKRKDGATLSTEHTVTWVRDEQAGSNLAVTVIRDVTARRLMEIERERLAAILEVTTDFVGMTDPAGRTVFVNRAGRRMMGIPESESLEGVSLREYHPEWASELVMEEAIPTAIREGVWRGETAIQARDGRIVPVSQVILAHKSDDGSVEYLSTIARDISERKLIEAELKEREQWYRSLIENVSDVITVIDPQMMIRFASSSSERVFGYAPEELVGQRALDLFHPDDHEVLSRALRRTLDRPGSIHDVEARLLHKEGSWRRVESVGMRPPGAERVIVTARDVTPRREAEEALRRSQGMLATVFETIPMATGIATAQEARFLEVNRAFLDLFGLTRQEVVGRTEYELGIWMDTDVRHRIGEAIAAGEPIDGVEVRLRGRGGPLTGLFFGERVEVGGEVCLLGIFYDTTEREQIEKQLREAQKMEAIARLAGGVAHDFNNLLTSIIGFTQLVLRDTEADDPRLPDLEEVLRSAERAAALTRQLLAFSRRDVLKPRPLDVNGIIGDMEDMIRRLMGEDVRVDTDLDPTLGTVMGDRGQIEQIVMNLVVNARDAMPDGGRLRLETRQTSLLRDEAISHPGAEVGNYARLSVCDTGLGVDEETQARMFEPFFTTKEPGKGTGLGLATVYGIVSQAGGFIDVESTIGSGTEVHIFLPTVNQQSEASDATVQVPEDTRGSETVLVAEDDEAVRSLCRNVLERRGYTVLEAGNGAEAVAVWRRHGAPVHLLITDLVMPEMNGRDLARVFAREQPEAAILFISGYADERVMGAGSDRSAIDWLQKPFTPQELARRVRQALDEGTGKDEFRD